MGTPVDWKIFTLKKNISYGPKSRKKSKSKSASVWLNTSLYNSLEINEFFWVKTLMGIQRFEVQFRAIFIVFGSKSKSCSQSAINWVASGLVVCNQIYKLKSPMGTDFMSLMGYTTHWSSHSSNWCVFLRVYQKLIKIGNTSHNE